MTIRGVILIAICLCVTNVSTAETVVSIKTNNHTRTESYSKNVFKCSVFYFYLSTIERKKGHENNESNLKKLGGLGVNIVEKVNYKVFTDLTNNARSSAVAFRSEFAGYNLSQLRGKNDECIHGFIENINKRKFVLKSWEFDYFDFFKKILSKGDGNFLIIRDLSTIIETYNEQL